MSNFDLVVIWRVCNPTLRQFTWRHKTPLQMSRLDFFFISNDLQFGVKSCENLCPLRSRVWIVVRPTENDSTRLYKNGDISVVISCSQLRFGR